MRNPIPIIGLAALLPALAFAQLPTPVHYWALDASGADSGSGGIDMDVTGTSSLDSAFYRMGGGSASFDSTLGTSGAVSQSTIDISAFANGDIRSICFWAKPDTSQGSNATMVGLGSSAANGYRFDIRIANGNLRVEIQGTGQETSAAITDNEWHHIAVVVPVGDAVSDDMLFYVDGVSVANNNTSGLAIRTAVGLVRLGDSSINAANREYNGWLDDVRIYDEALSLSQITDVIAEADVSGPSTSGFAAGSEVVFLGASTDLMWDAFAIDIGDTLEITNDQDATVIDAKTPLAASNTGTRGVATVSPAVATVYTLELNGTPVGSVAVNVETVPRMNSLTVAPDKFYGLGGDATLSWSTEGAQRLEITNDVNGDVETFTLTLDGQAFLDAGTFDVTVGATTTYTLRGWLDEAGSGDQADLTATVIIQPGPDLTLVAAPGVFSGSADVTLYFNATVGEQIVTSGLVDSWGLGGNTFGDTSLDYSLLSAGMTYYMRATSGVINGQLSLVTAWDDTAKTITIVDGDAWDVETSWNGDYDILELTGADLLEIDDDNPATTPSPLFSTTDQTLIRNGSFNVGTVTTDTTYTATATIGGAGSTQATASVDADGTGSSYEEVVLVDGPVGYYPCNEDSLSTVVYDISGNGNHSTELIGDLDLGEAGAIGTAHRFNNSETVTIGVTLDPSDPNATGASEANEGFTMEALVWTDHSDAPAGTRVIMSNLDGTGLGRSNLFAAEVGDLGSYFGGRPQRYSAEIVDQSWSHVVLTVSYDDARAIWVGRAYVDGELTAAVDYVDGTGVSDPPEAANGNWRIGSHKSRQAGQFFNGLLDEWAIYDYPLDDPNMDGDMSDSRVPAHSEAFLANTAGLLAFERDDVALRNSPYDLYYKVGGLSTSAVINPGGIVVTPGTAGTATVYPSVDTTYTLDVDGDTKSVLLQVYDQVLITGFGTDNGAGFPYADATGLAEGFTYQLFTSDDLATWGPSGVPVIGPVGGTGTFTDGTAFDPVVRPKRFYRVDATVGPPAE